MRESRTYGSVRGALSNGCPYRVRCVFAAALRSRFGAKRRLMRRTKEHLISSPSPTAVLWRQACRAPGFRHGLGQQRWKRKGGAESACAKRWLQL